METKCSDHIHGWTDKQNAVHTCNEKEGEKKFSVLKGRKILSHATISMWDYAIWNKTPHWMNKYCMSVLMRYLEKLNSIEIETIAVASGLWGKWNGELFIR